jgi:hypothetical protein
MCRTLLFLKYNVMERTIAQDFAVTRYLLAPHACLRVIGSHAILLDINRDKYLAITNAPELWRNIEDWPESESVHESGGEGIIQQLVALKLLTTDHSAGKSAAAVDVPVVRADLMECWRKAEFPIRAQLVRRLRLSYAETLISRISLPLRHQINALRMRAAKGRVTEQRPDMSGLAALVGTFLSLRPLYYSAQNHCLFDSMVLINFLNRCGIFPLLVIGVKTNPFGAHCWVQIDDCALNETETRARQYQSILAV